MVEREAYSALLVRRCTHQKMALADMV